MAAPLDANLIVGSLRDALRLRQEQRQFDERLAEAARIRQDEINRENIDRRLRLAMSVVDANPEVVAKNKIFLESVDNDLVALGMPAGLASVYADAKASKLKSAQELNDQQRADERAWQLNKYEAEQEIKSKYDLMMDRLKKAGEPEAPAAGTVVPVPETGGNLLYTGGKSAQYVPPQRSEKQSPVAVDFVPSPTSPNVLIGVDEYGQPTGTYRSADSVGNKAVAVDFVPSKTSKNVLIGIDKDGNPTGEYRSAIATSTDKPTEGDKKRAMLIKSVGGNPYIEMSPEGNTIVPTKRAVDVYGRIKKSVEEKLTPYQKQELKNNKFVFESDVDNAHDLFRRAVSQIAKTNRTIEVNRLDPKTRKSLAMFDPKFGVDKNSFEEVDPVDLVNAFAQWQQTVYPKITPVDKRVLRRMYEAKIKKRPKTYSDALKEARINTAALTAKERIRLKSLYDMF